MKEISRWANTQAQREAGCPRCFANPNSPCVQPSGRKAPMIHSERVKLYAETIGRDEFDRRHGCRISKPFDLQGGLRR